MFNTSTNKLTTRDIAFYGLFIALVYVATRFINVPGPTPGGLFHLGNVMAFSIAIVFGKKAGAVSGALGMTLFDLTSSYFAWAPFTFIIRFAMGYVLGAMASKAGDNKTKTVVYSLFGILISTIIMIAGYYAAEVILYSNLYLPIKSVYGNFMQCVVGTVIGLPLAATLKIAFKARNISVEM
jgi:uncharacterized membrane protein